MTDSEHSSRDRVARLHSGTAELVRATDRAELFERVVDIAERILAFDQSVVLQREGDRFVDLSASPPLSPELVASLPAEGSLTAQVDRSREPMLVVDADEHPEAFTEAHDLRSAVMVPLGDGAIFQALSTEPGTYDEGDLELAELLCSHATETLARIEAEAEAERRRERVTRLHRATADMVRTTDPTDLYQQVVDVAADMLGFEHAVVFTPEGDRFVRQAVAPDAPTEYPTEYPLDHGLMAEVREKGTSAVVEDAWTHPKASPEGVDFRSGVVVPIGAGGVFEGLSRTPHAHDETDLELAELLSSYATETLARIEAEADRRVEHDRFEALFQNVSGAAGFYELVDGSPHARRVNRAFEETFGYDAAELVGENLDEYIVPPAERERASDFNERLERGESVRAEVERQTADGLRHFLLQIIPLALDERNAGGFAIYTDITEQRERERALREQHDRFEALFENVPDAAVFYEYVDDKPIVRRVNPAFEAVFGYDAETITGENVDEYIIPTGSWSEADDLNGRLTRGESLRTEVERVTVDGPRDFILHVVPTELGTANLGGFAIYTDVTEQKRREQDLQAQNERLDEFASVVSHDLRNPLNVAQGYLDLAQETGDESHLGRVAAAHDRMNELVSELLTLAREGRDVGDVERVDLATVAERAWANVETGRLTLGAADGVEVEADPDRLAELLENLYRNAVEHAGDDVTVEVGPLETRTGEGRPGGFYVADDGPGLADDMDVFEAGVTTSPDGTGFGLSIVQQIAEAHGWRVEAVKGADGARFEFVF